MNIKRNILIFNVFWTAIVASSLGWMLHSATEEKRQIATLTARSAFKQIVITRRWNSGHGGVYVPITEKNQPNPYLEDERRDLRINESFSLTKINPAFMTRQISEIAMEEDGIRFHITSLKPIRPQNEATPVEKEFLSLFEQGSREESRFMEEEGRKVFKYMAPLLTEKSCLKCHAKQGYKEGDIRGGIAVSLPFALQIPTASMTLSHLVIWIIGFVGMNVLGFKLDRSYGVIKRQAVMDVLTGIPNRRSFSERILAEFTISKKSAAELSLIICDIDYFKKYNDFYGHVEGDACLRRVAQCIQESLKRPVDFCARYGGEEFVVVLPNSSLMGAITVAERIRSNVEDLQIPHQGSTAGQFVTLSLGLATNKLTNAHSHEHLIQCADEALYLAKARGRNQVVHFEPGSEPRMERK
jgi:diguanylate cyclase (GGDEF)-like protein